MALKVSFLSELQIPEILGTDENIGNRRKSRSIKAPKNSQVFVTWGFLKCTNNLRTC